jgi:hypothetical protein
MRYAIANATASWSRRRPSSGIDVSKVVETIEEEIAAHDPAEFTASFVRKARKWESARSGIQFRN